MLSRRAAPSVMVGNWAICSLTFGRSFVESEVFICGFVNFAEWW